jgi:hypothetical protein
MIAGVHGAADLDGVRRPLKPEQWMGFGCSR